MARSFGHVVYNALSRRKPGSAPREAPPRPEGELLWVHAAGVLRYSALCDLGLRLAASRPGLNTLVTVEAERFETLPVARAGCFRIEPLGSDGPEAAQAFLRHWRPDVCLWTGGDLMPTLIGAAKAQAIPMVLVDVDESEWQSPLHKWFPAVLRETLGCFDTVMVTSPGAAKLVQRAGLPKSRITVTGRLGNSVTPPACPDRQLTRTVRDINARPVWLAAHVPASEVGSVLAAHGAALRLLHRLLLVVTAARREESDQLRAALEQSGLRFADWAAGGTIEDGIQVVMAEDDSDLGLWYRIAPLTYIGGSLEPGGGGRNPLEPAALGSAILCGPEVRDHGDAFARLTASGATRTVRTGDELAAAGVQLSAPDKAAAMALAGWEAVTESAQLTDGLIDLVQDLLDRREASHAGP